MLTFETGRMALTPGKRKANAAAAGVRHHHSLIVKLLSHC